MKYLIIVFCCIAFLCVNGANGGRIDVKQPPQLKVEITQQVECYKKSKYGDVLHIHYKGYLADGTEFDNTYKRGHMVIFTIGTNNVIKGWDQGLLGMCQGEKRRLIVPPELAYGDEGFSTLVPPGATLTFDCELLHINLRDEL
ncbi:hypothetical protein HA402_005699 [Bradysia odoriphaga]|nr:hypothetical protein HA402_005699 [Bradysia odoriphaga]